MNKILKILLVSSLFTGIVWAKDAIDLPFSKAIKAGNTLYLSGEIAYDAKLGKVVSGGIEAETKKVLSNIENTLKKNNYDKKDVVKCMVMLTDIKDFKQFNGVYKEFFSKPYPTRSTFVVKDLALNAKIEIECLAIK